MKRSISTAVAFSAMLAGQVYASGPYDGVYQYGLSPVYYSVHQNGNTLLVVSLGLLSTDGTIEITVGPHTIAPTMLGDWDYAMGTVTGNRARISGTDLYGSCITVNDVVIENGTVTATFVSSTNTAFGTAQGVNCAQLIGGAAASLGGSITLRKIF
jgi:hypothetical protein